MIRNKKDYEFYLQEDRKRNLKIEKFNIYTWAKYQYYLFIKHNGAIAYNYLKSLRKLELAINCKKGNSIVGKIIYRIRLIKYLRLSYKYHIYINPNTVGYGLYLPHISGVIVNCKSMGNYCKINCGVLLGNKHSQDEIPIIGDNVDMTTGCKIIGKVIIGNNVIIAPNSVVVKDVPENAVVSGIPARILKYIDNSDQNE